MSHTVYPHKFLSWAASFHNDENAVSRLLAGYSAAIALADRPALSAMVRLGRDHSLGHCEFYEIVLQSYLFLGFPRMLVAAEHLAECLEEPARSSLTAPISRDEAQDWFEDGMTLCRRVYGGGFESLKRHVEAIAPDVFRWMIIEGYGKVLSRPGVSTIDRELAVVACLIVENRPRQLDSHLHGALNVGAGRELLGTIVEDLKDTAPDGYRTAVSLLAGLNNDR